MPPSSTANRGKRAKLYALIVDHPFRGEVRVGPLYPNKQAAQGWRSFVRAAWNGLPVSVEHVASRIGGAK